MHRFVAGGVVLGTLLLVCMVAPGCFCFSQPSRDIMVEAPPPAAPEKEPAPPPARPAPKAVEEPLPPPPPAVPTPPPAKSAALPPAVVKAIEDLGEKYPGLFVFDKETGLFRFSSDITFDSGSAVVKPGARAALGKLAQILSDDQVSDRRLTIVGHTDSDRVRKADTIARLKSLGKSPDNMGLSEARAEAVAAILKSGGIDSGRIVTQGQGQSAPIADNRSPEGKARNRRVEIYLTSMSGAAPAAKAARPSGK
ncbi:MAG: OmpA family protein [Planctomycetota bacterium]|nr:OmpA family protein [Planctomycetota bacterium]